MGVRRAIPEEKLTEEKIQQCLRREFLSPSGKKYEIFNMFVYGWESDYLAITKSNYIYEVEIKISRNDFFNDFKHKVRKHLMLEGKYHPTVPSYVTATVNFDVDENRPNYFYYAVPENMVSADEVPEYAGLIYITKYHRCNIVKQAPKLVKESKSLEKLNLESKFYYGYINWRDKCQDYKVDELRKCIRRLEKELSVYDDLLSEANNKIDELKLELREYEQKRNIEESGERL